LSKNLSVNKFTNNSNQFLDIFNENSIEFNNKNRSNKNLYLGMGSKTKLIINADDAGISMGVNNAIKQMVDDGRLNSLSLMVNGFYAKQIADFCNTKPRIEKNLMCGLHFNLTTGSSILGNQKLSKITKPDGTFKYGFLLLSILCFFSKKVRTQIELELRAQIDAMHKLGIKDISHIDGHRHVHFIPPIFAIVTKVAEFYKIPRIRIINEQIFQTALTTGFVKTFFNTGFIKWMILKTFYLINKTINKNLIINNKTYFFSIIHSCKINQKILNKIKFPDEFYSIEIMIHPGEPKTDTYDKNIKYEKHHLQSHDRTEEALVDVKKIT